MSYSFDIWKMLAGVAFLLLAMDFMESALRGLAGRQFKLFLKKETTNRAKAISAGAVVTALLQSSSIINLLILNLVGAGVVQMENALALILGSNLGTTLNSWVVAIFGFNYNIESLALPVAGLTGILMVFINKGTKWYLWCKFLFSFAFLFISLGFIKSGMEAFALQSDLIALRKFSLIVFLAAGILITSLVQSSSVTMALALSALHSNTLTLSAAMAVALGAEIGTTLKLFLASARGIAVKKRVALGNFLFNVSTVGIIFLLLSPIHYLIVNTLSIKDNLIALVFFQSFVNLTGILLFTPLLPVISKFLLKRYREAGDESSYISKVAATDPDLALEALERETKHFIQHVVGYGCDSFNLGEEITKNTNQKEFNRKTVAEKYQNIKHLHGEIHGFYLKLQNLTTEKKDSERLNQLISSIRNSMYAAKNIRDAQHDIEQMRNSSNDIKYDFYLQSRQKLLDFSQRIGAMADSENKQNAFEELTNLYHSVSTGYSETLQILYKETLVNRVSETEISTLINFNRQLYSYFKSLIFGVKDYLLTTKEGEYFDSLPGFIR